MAASVLIERGVGVRMRDDVVLAADVYRPDDDAAYPVLVERIPYGKHAPIAHSTMFNAVDAVERGYAVLIQDCRGRFASEGEWEPFVNEADDGHDTVEWAAAQPWSNGRVGVYGCSYMATTALQAAVARPAHLGAVVAYMGGVNLHHGWVYTSGAFELGLNVYWTTRRMWESLSRLDVDDQERDRLSDALHEATATLWRSVHHLPLTAIPGLHAYPGLTERLAPYWGTWLSHPAYDDYWRGVDAVARADLIAAPVLHVSGWFDTFLAGHLALNDALKRHPDPRIRHSHQFVIGPWDHNAYVGPSPTAAGQVDFGPKAMNGPPLLTPLALEWFDRWLRDGSQAMPVERARFYVTGTAQWRSASTWPPAAAARPLFLRGNGAANSRSGDGHLSWDPPGRAEPADAYDYDPAAPVPTTGGRTLAPMFGPPGIVDQSAVEERHDVLVYSTETLEAPLSVAGPVKVKLHVSSTAEDTDFTAKLVDVGTDGFCANICEGIVRARHRHGVDRIDWLEPDTVTPVDIDLLAAAHTFQPGHRVRLEVASSNFPRFARSMNGRVEPGEASQEDVRSATQRIFHDAEHPSCVTLPVLQWKDTRVSRSTRPLLY